MNTPHAPRPSRRQVLHGALGASLALPALRLPFAGPYPSDAPEQKKLSIGIVAVASCASLVIAKERGFFERHGLEVTLVKESSWASCRDKLLTGENQASHVKYAQPLGISLGAQGSTPTPLVAPLTLARSGSAFLIPRALGGVLTRDPATWAAYNAELKKKGEALTIALPWFWGWHAMIWRHFLATGGIHADRDFKLVTMPPAQMVQNMKVGSMQACGMVEPWGVRGVRTNVANILFYGHEIWPNHPTKSLGLRADFADKHPKTVRAMLCAVLEAARWCDEPDNRPELARVLATPSYLNVPADQLQDMLLGKLGWGDGRTADEPANAIRYSHDTYPQAREFKWMLAHLCRWGFVPMSVDFDRAVEDVLRTDLHAAATAALGLPAGVRNDEPIVLSDGDRFEHQKARAYVEAFKIHSRKD